MKSLLNITKETAYYRGKEITHGIGYDAYMLELNKLDKKFGRVSGHNSSKGFNVETAFVDHLGTAARSPKASWDAVSHDGKKWEIRTRNFCRVNAGIHFVGSTDAQTRPWTWYGQGTVFDCIKKKCNAVDTFLVADTSRTGEKGLLEWWEIPSKTIIELYTRDEWRGALTKAGKVRRSPDGKADKEMYQLSIARFRRTMKWIFNK